MDITCNKCDFYTGKPNQADGSFICSKCKKDYDCSYEKAEARYMGWD